MSAVLGASEVVYTLSESRGHSKNLVAVNYKFSKSCKKIFAETELKKARTILKYCKIAFFFV